MAGRDLESSSVLGATVDELAQRILSSAGSAGLGQGDRLPTERELVAGLGATRTTVRHALSRLEAAGLLSREVGRGTFLRGPASSATDESRVPSLRDVAPADVMAVRALIEPRAMGYVVLRATERDLGDIERSLAGGDSAVSYSDFEAWDLALHRCLIAATHNPLLVKLYEAVEAARHSNLWGQLKRRNDSGERREQYCCEHHRIVAAVRSRDREAAIAAMDGHLASVSTNLFGTVL